MLSRWHEDLAAHDEAFACLQDLLDPSSFATTVVKAFREWGQGPRQIRSNFHRRLAAFNHGAPACVGTLEAVRCRIWLRSCRLIALSFDARGGDGVIWA